MDDVKKIGIDATNNSEYENRIRKRNENESGQEKDKKNRDNLMEGWRC
jgi:hypothetical protein